MILTHKIIKTPEDHDSNTILFYENEEKIGHGFIPKDEEKVCIQRCPECKRENYALAVISGLCTWCGFSYKLENLK